MRDRERDGSQKEGDVNVLDVLDVTEMSPKPTHSVWRCGDGQPYGVKVPFQFGGKVQKYQKLDETAHALDTLSEEAAFIDFLSARRMGPERRAWIYYKTVISEHLGDGARWADPCGAYGWEIANAAELAHPGEFTVEALKATDMIRASTGAWSDAAKPWNIVNGYLVDTRRSWWDRLQYCGPIELRSRPVYTEKSAALTGDLLRDGSFPFRERELPYQEFYLDGVWNVAEREVHKRALTLGMSVKPGDTVLDLGSCLGGFPTWAMLHGASRCVGLDYQTEFVLLARRLARANSMNIGYFQFDLMCIERESITQIAQHLDWIGRLFPNGVDHLVCLSMGKHLSEPIMWWWVDHLKARHTYLETNAIKTDTPQWKLPYYDGVRTRNGTLIGYTQDRNLRAAYRIDRA